MTDGDLRRVGDKLVTRFYEVPAASVDTNTAGLVAITFPDLRIVTHAIVNAGSGYIADGEPSTTVGEENVINCYVYYPTNYDGTAGEAAGAVVASGSNLCKLYIAANGYE